MRICIVLFLGFVFTPTSHAWEISQNVKIHQLVQWEGSGNFLIVLTNNKRCFGPVADKDLYALVLALHLADRSLSTYCYNEAQTINGYGDVHKLHRVNVF